MTNHSVIPAKPQEKAKKPTFNQRYGALIDRAASEMGYNATQKSLFTNAVRRLDRGAAA